jgi:hypothetical protein
MHTSIHVGVRAGRPQFRAGQVHEGTPFLIKRFLAGGKGRGGGGGTYLHCHISFGCSQNIFSLNICILRKT